MQESSRSRKKRSVKLWPFTKQENVRQREEEGGEGLEVDEKEGKKRRA